MSKGGAKAPYPLSPPLDLCLRWFEHHNNKSTVYIIIWFREISQNCVRPARL